MADAHLWKEICRVVSLCVAWFLISSSNNVVGKTLLTDFQYPATVTMVQLLVITALSGPLFKAWGVRPLGDISWRYYCTLILPLAFGKFFSSLFSHVSIWKVPVSYAHTVKGTMPLFTVVLSRLILGERQTNMVYLSLVPIIVGVLIATVTEISFDVIGLISALISTLGFSLQNIFSKKVLHDTSIHHLRLLHLLAKLAFMMFLPFWLYFDFWNMLDNDIMASSPDFVFSMFLLFLDGVLNFAQNIVAFSVLHLVTPLTYSVCSATKRISVIIVSLILLKNPVTLTNIFGMMLAVLGVLAYNKAKYDANQAKKKQSVLPLTVIPDPGINQLLSNGLGHLYSDTATAQISFVPNGTTHNSHLLNHVSNGDLLQSR